VDRRPSDRRGYSGPEAEDDALIAGASLEDILP
jgi:hypothetical protein